MMQTICRIKLTEKEPDSEVNIVLALVFAISSLSVTSAIIGLFGSMQVTSVI